MLTLQKRGAQLTTRAGAVYRQAIRETAFVLGVLMARLFRSVAGVHETVAESPAGVAMMSCAAAGCENQVSDMSSTGFCFTCLGDLQRDMNELSEELAKLLRLEAEFVAFCQAKGLPHPHE